MKLCEPINVSLIEETQSLEGQIGKDKQRSFLRAAGEQEKINKPIKY